MAILIMKAKLKILFDSASTLIKFVGKFIKYETNICSIVVSCCFPERFCRDA